MNFVSIGWRFFRYDHAAGCGWMSLVFTVSSRSGLTRATPAPSNILNADRVPPLVCPGILVADAGDLACFAKRI